MPTSSNNRTRSHTSGSRRERAAADQPGNSFDYLYWRLSEGQFQKLVSTVLRDKYDPVRCYPIGMGDQGIDAITHNSVIYQVKWSSKYQQNPASWLKSTIDKEREKIHALVREGRATRYILVTSVAGTTTGQGTGSIQKLDRDLEAYTEEFGIPIECWWQSDLDAEITRMGDGIKWKFQEMLAGSDAIRYLIFGTQVEGDAARMRETMQKVVQAQWSDDSQIRFSQVELKGVDLLELFVDVHASLISPPRNALREFELQGSRQPSTPHPAAATLLTTTVPLTFLLGVPGQGKSTLTQYLCQQHRGTILASQGIEDPLHATVPLGEPKLPLRIELKDYAEWIDGYDPFDEHRKVTRRRSRTARSAETYIAELCSTLSGGRKVTVEEVQSLLERYPTLLVFDGLDEVANPELRAIVVEEIEQLITRIGRSEVRPNFQILVTSRPNSTGLAEPDPRRFQRLRLEPLSDALQNEYVIKWCDARNIDGAQRSDIRRIFRDRTALDHVAQLADNPMQLTILLYLISRKGDAVPVSRTPLYSSYMETLLDREVAGGHIGRNAAPQVEEVTAFLGWHMQSGVENAASAGTMVRRDLENTILLYLKEVEAAGHDAAAIFRAASDRFWALTSKVDGQFEFVVQPVREYFAARFLAEWAGRDLKAPLSKEEVLAEMLGRPYWLNTTRFYAGFASPNELGALRYGIEEAMASGSNAIETRVAAWTLLSDAVFLPNPKMQRDVVGLLVDDATLLFSALEEHAPQFTRLTPDAGGRQLIEALTNQIVANPRDPLAPARIDMLRRLAPLSRREFLDWWTPNLIHSLGTRDECTWLDLAARFRIGSIPDDLSTRLTLTDAAVRSAAIRAGIAAVDEESISLALTQSVLDGNVAGVPPRASGAEASLLLAAMRPEWFHAMMRDSLPAHGEEPNTAELTAADKAYRNSAWAKLVKLNPDYARLRNAARLNQSHQGGTTEPWGAPARELTKLKGPSWLAAEIAIAAAAAPHLHASGSRSSGGQPFGTEVDYGNLITEVHALPAPDWWSRHYHRLVDNLSLRTWAVALIAAGTDQALAVNVAQIDEVMTSLTPQEFESTTTAASRIALNGASRGRVRVIEPGHALSDRTRLLMSYFEVQAESPNQWPLFTDDELTALASPAPSRWPIARALAARVLSEETPALLSGITMLGPDAVAGLFPVDPGRANLDLARRVITSPGDFSIEWFLYARAALNDTSNREPLEKVAAVRGWVPRIPRYA